MSDSLRPHGLYVTTRLLCPWDFPGENTGVGRYFLLQGIFLTQGLNLCLLLWQARSLANEEIHHSASQYIIIVLISSVMLETLRYFFLNINLQNSEDWLILVM